MKKILSVLTVIVVLAACLLSCSIEAPRPYSGDLTIEVTGLPSSVKAVAMFCNLNEWKPELVNDTTFIQLVEGGKVIFSPADIPELVGYMYSEELQVQFVPLTSASAKLDGSWWSKAISGSSAYANAKNNLVYDFASRGAGNPMKISLDVSGSVADILVQRVHFENFNTILTATF